MNEKHWFSFSFMGEGLSGDKSVFASCYIGYDNQLISKVRIAEAKRSALVKEDSTLLSVSYLGFMSKDTFIGG